MKIGPNAVTIAPRVRVPGNATKSPSVVDAAHRPALRVQRWGWQALALIALTLGAFVTGCQSGGRPAATPALTIGVGTQAQIEDVGYIAIERVGTDRLSRDRLEAAGEVRIEALARRIPAFRLANSPKAALRYSEDGPRGWLAWQPLAVLYARRDLAQSTGLPVGQIQTVDVQHETWPDSCLGAARAPESCAPIAVPGFRVFLRLAGRSYEYHTDLNDRTVNATP